jgi:lactate dehydrogenase-like 2-hydroxyacid dehydrogenase
MESGSSSASENHLTVVALETQFGVIPQFNIPKPFTYTLICHERTTGSEIVHRVKSADILITTTLPLNAQILSADVSPKLRLVACMASGTDSIDLEACKRRGIVVCNSSHANTAAVSEHAIGLYFSTRRRFIQTQQALNTDEWTKQGTLMRILEDQNGMPRTCADEIMGLIGYGVIGMLGEH